MLLTLVTIRSVPGASGMDVGTTLYSCRDQSTTGTWLCDTIGIGSRVYYECSGNCWQGSALSDLFEADDHLPTPCHPSRGDAMLPPLGVMLTPRGSLQTTQAPRNAPDMLLPFLDASKSRSHLFVAQSTISDLAEGVSAGVTGSDTRVCKQCTRLTVCAEYFFRCCQRTKGSRSSASHCRPAKAYYQP